MNDPILTRKEILDKEKQEKARIREIKRTKDKLKKLQLANIEAPEIVKSIKNIGRIIRHKDPVTGKETKVFGRVTVDMLASAVPTTKHMVQIYIKRGLISPAKQIQTKRHFELSVNLMQIEERKTQDLALLKRRLKILEDDTNKDYLEKTWQQSLLTMHVINERNRKTPFKKKILDRHDLHQLALDTVSDDVVHLITGNKEYFEGAIIRGWIERGTFPKPQTIRGSQRHLWANPKALAQILQINLDIQKEGGTKSLNYPFLRLAAQHIFKKTRLPRLRVHEALK